MNFWSNLELIFSTKRHNFRTKINCCIILGDINSNSTYTNANTQPQAYSVVSDMNRLLISWLRFFDTRRETQFLKAYANHTIWPHFNARWLWCLRSLSIEIRKTQLHLPRPKSNSLPPWSNLNFSTDSFSKSSSSQDHLFRAWCHPHSYPISCLVFFMTMMSVISFAREPKTAPKDYAPELLTQMVQSPTKLNDKI